MNMRVTGVVCVLALAVCLGLGHAASAEAQRPSKWWHDPACKTQVGLSQAQASEIDQVFLSVRDELRAEKAELEKQEAALSRLLAENNDNEAVVVRTIDRVEAARSALAKTRTLMLYRMHRLLSSEQRRKLEAYERARAASESQSSAQRPRE